jgi:hypothetical protein
MLVFMTFAAKGPLFEQQQLFFCLYGLGVLLNCWHQLQKRNFQVVAFMKQPFDVIDVVIGVCAIGPVVHRRREEMDVLFLALAICCLWISLLNTFRFHSSLGPLVGVIFNMGVMLSQFMLIALVVAAGFGSALFCLLNGINDDFETINDVLIKLFSAALGDFDLNICAAESCSPRESLASALIVVYVLLMPIMLMNLLIAVLTDAYAQVSEDKTKEYQSTKAQAIMKFQSLARQAICPSPLNLIGFLPGIDRRSWLEFVLLLFVGPLALISTVLVPVFFVSGPLAFAAFERGKRGYWDEVARTTRSNTRRTICGTLVLVFATPPVLVYVYLYQLCWAIFKLVLLVPVDIYHCFTHETGSSSAMECPWEFQLDKARDAFTDETTGNDKLLGLVDECIREAIGDDNSDCDDSVDVNTRRKIVRIASCLKHMQREQELTRTLLHEVHSKLLPGNPPELETTKYQVQTDAETKRRIRTCIRSGTNVQQASTKQRNSQERSSPFFSRVFGFASSSTGPQKRRGTWENPAALNRKGNARGGASIEATLENAQIDSEYEDNKKTVKNRSKRRQQVSSANVRTMV